MTLDLQHIRSLFPALSSATVFLDNPGGTQIVKHSLEHINRYLVETNANHGGAFPTSEASDALVEGYRVAGKTGTAEIPTPMGYTSNETNASFVGWGPVDDPQFLVYVWLEKPSVSPWGSVVAAPVFRDAVKELVVLLNLPPDDVRRSLSKGN